MPIFSEYESFDALGLANLIRQGVISPQELLEAAIERIELHNPKINAVIFKMYDHARNTTKKNLLPAGPFSGVPILLKDLLAEYAGVPMQSGSRFAQNYLSMQDSEVVKRMKQAGVVILGKTNTPEFGLSPTTEPEAFGATRNPWNLSRTAGGSSGGSAAAIASRMVPIAHGSDGAGSIRIPAAYCGLFGLKPSRGRTPNGPAFLQVWHGMVVENVLTRSVRDSAAMLDVLSGPEAGSAISLPKPDISFLESLNSTPHKLKIALIEKPFFPAKIDAEYLAALQNAGKLCESLGHSIEPVALEINSAEVAKAFVIFIAAETASMLNLLIRYQGRKPKYHELERQTDVLCKIGKQFSAVDYAWATQVLDKVRGKIAEFFEKYDVMMTPTIAQPPAKIGEFKPDRFEQGMLEMISWFPHRFLLQKLIERASVRNFAFTPYTPLFNISGNPAMSVPLYWDQEGLPIGIQFAGRFGDEMTLLQLAAQLEEAQPWGEKRPQL